MSKGAISRDSVYLGIHILNVENTVLSTSCPSYHEEFIDLYIHIHVSPHPDTQKISVSVNV